MHARGRWNLSERVQGQRWQGASVQAAQEESVAHSVWRFNFMLLHELLIFVLFVWAEAGMS